MNMFDVHVTCFHLCISTTRHLDMYILFTYFPKLLKIRFLTQYVLLTYFSKLLKLKNFTQDTFTTSYIKIESELFFVSKNYYYYYYYIYLLEFPLAISLVLSHNVVVLYACDCVQNLSKLSPTVYMQSMNLQIYKQLTSKH